MDGRPAEAFAVKALYVADPSLLGAYKYFRGIVTKIVHKKPLSPVERKIVKRVLRLRVPREYVVTVEKKYERLQMEYPSVKGALEEIASRAHGKHVLKDPVFVFSVVQDLSGHGGLGIRHRRGGRGVQRAREGRNRHANVRP